MASVVKIHGAPKPYEVRWSWYDAHGHRHFKRERFRTDREAKTKQREVEQSVADANMPDYAAGRKSLAHWAERWYDSKAAKTKPSTSKNYRAILDGSVLPAFGSARVRAITTADIQEWIDGLEQAPPTVKHHFGVLRNVLRHAVKGRAIPADPTPGVELPSDRAVGRTRREPFFLTIDQIERLAEALADKPPYDLLVRFTAYTGLRAAEVAGLNIGDVDFLHSRLRVNRTRQRIGSRLIEHTPKSGKGRQVPLPPWLRDDLAALLATHPRRAEPDAPLWPGRSRSAQPGGLRGALDWTRPYEHGVFYRRHFAPAVRAAKLDGVVFHDLRHTYASLMAREGVPPYRVARYMGHADATITLKVYTHLWDDDASADAALLARPTAERSVVSPMK